MVLVAVIVVIPVVLVATFLAHCGGGMQQWSSVIGRHSLPLPVRVAQVDSSILVVDLKNE